jgi:hypothetical protein
VDEERQGREEDVGAKLKIFRAMLPIWLKRLSKLKDPRQAEKLNNHQLKLVG